MADISLLCKTAILDELRSQEPLFGQWTITEFIGAGANGCVFKLGRQDLGQEFVSALKVIPLSQDSSRRDRSDKTIQDSINKDAREILHLYKLSGHTNIISWHNHQIFHKKDGDTHSAYICVMMDYLPNSLAELLKKGPLPWNRAIPLIIGCLSGLEHIHAQMIIHRDIKPENVFITSDGTAKIGDFGISRQLSESMQAQTRTGTPLYMAPEVFRDPLGEGYGLTADIYSMGLVAYEMVEGRLPFEEKAGGTQNMIRRRFSGAVPTFSPQIPMALRKAILHALILDASKRYQSAREFRLALEAIPLPEADAPAPEAKAARPQQPSLGAGDMLNKAKPDASVFSKSKKAGRAAGLRPADSEKTVAMDGEDLAQALHGAMSSGSGTIVLKESGVDDSGPARDKEYSETIAVSDPGRDAGDLDDWDWDEDQAMGSVPGPDTPKPAKEPDLGISLSVKSNRRLVNILECDSAQEGIFYSGEVCKRLLALGKELIRKNGAVPVELNNRSSLNLDPDRICCRILSLGILDGVFMGEVEILDSFKDEVETLFDLDSYVLAPKCIGQYLPRGEYRALRSINLKLVSFSLYEV